MKFLEWMRLKEMMGSVSSIVSCKDCRSKDFTVQGAYCSRCGKKSDKIRKFIK